MESRNLHTFVTVAQLQSVSLAAAKLHLTQPAVTKRIQLLEQQLDTPLFDRIGRNLSLNEAGTCLLPFATSIMQLVDQGRQALADLNSEVKGVLKLVTSHHIGLHRLPRLLQAYKKQYPLVKVQIAFMDSAEAHHSILAGEADLGVTTQAASAENKINAFTIWEDKLEFVVAKLHPLTRRKNLQLADIAAYPAILPEQKFHTAQLVSALFEKHRLQLRLEEGLSTNYLETIKAMLIIGDTWSVLPATMLDSKNLAVLSPKGVSMSRELVCIRHQDRSLNRASEAFIRLLGNPNKNPDKHPDQKNPLKSRARGRP